MDWSPRAIPTRLPTRSSSSRRRIEDDAEGRVACETLVTTGLVVVAGEMNNDTYVDVGSIVRDRRGNRLHARGVRFDAETCGVTAAIDEQSPDIAQGVDERSRPSMRH